MAAGVPEQGNQETTRLIEELVRVGREMEVACCTTSCPLTECRLFPILEQLCSDYHSAQKHTDYSSSFTMAFLSLLLLLRLYCHEESLQRRKP